jgi:uncharacterized protein YjiS (DUF1127 family)
MNIHTADEKLDSALGHSSSRRMGLILRSIRRFWQEHRKRRAEQKALASLDIHMLRDIGLGNFQSRPGLPPWAVYNPHLIAIGMVGPKSR